MDSSLIRNKALRVQKVVNLAGYEIDEVLYVLVMILKAMIEHFVLWRGLKLHCGDS